MLLEDTKSENFKCDDATNNGIITKIDDYSEVSKKKEDTHIFPMLSSP